MSGRRATAGKGRWSMSGIIIVVVAIIAVVVVAAGGIGDTIVEQLEKAVKGIGA